MEMNKYIRIAIIVAALILIAYGVLAKARQNQRL